MSEIAIAHRPEDSAFNRGAMLVVAAIGVVAFIAMLLLGAYAPSLRSGRDGGAHALSNAATGFNGLVRLAEATGRNPVIVRSVAELKSEDLAVVTPEDPDVNLDDILESRGARVTLVVLPKWVTQADPRRPGWVRVVELLDPSDPERVLAPGYKYRIGRATTKRTPLRTVDATAPGELGFASPPVTQFLAGKGVQPAIVDDQNRIVLGKIADEPLYILADPDLLNNHGVANSRQAAAALALLDFLNSTGAEGILFDVTANGLGHSRNPLRLLFDPPFLAITLVIFVAMLLAGWQALVRFGEPRRPERALAFGKAALVENSAALIRKAGRETHLASRYVDTIRERAAALFRLPPSLRGNQLDERLDGLRARSKFSELAAAAEASQYRDELLLAARKLNRWLEEVSA